MKSIQQKHKNINFSLNQEFFKSKDIEKLPKKNSLSPKIDKMPIRTLTLNKKKLKFQMRKITHPKLPFSKRIVEDPKKKEERIMKLKPSLKFHDFHTIQWLRHKYNDAIIEKSIYTLLPQNGKPVIPEDESEEDKKKRELLEWLSEYCHPTYKNININPKYFFNRVTFQKILKLKEIFLEFDEDGSRKMEIDEMVNMFNDNHIAATMAELVTLFFKDKKVKEEDIEKLYLDFYQFMNFTLNKDQDFRIFMRKIKEKYKKQNLNEEENGYLPMNFNLLLDYFITKGKERASIKVIEDAIDEMDKIINKNQNGNPDSELAKKTIRDSTKRNDEIKELSQQLEKINFTKLIKEFSKLFSINGLGTKSQDDTSKRVKSKGTRAKSNEYSNFKKSISNYNLSGNEKERKDRRERKETKITDNNIELKELGDECSIENNNSKNEDTYLTDLVRTEMKKKAVLKMNMMNYNKLHNLKLAIDETKNQLKNYPEYKQFLVEPNKDELLMELQKAKTRNESLPIIKSKVSAFKNIKSNSYVNFNKGINNTPIKVNYRPKKQQRAYRNFIVKDYVPPELLY